MDTVEVLDLFREALFLVMLISSVFILPSLVVGLIVSTFQAATQINEQTLGFYPRLIMTFVSMLIAGPWVLGQLLDFFHKLLSELPMFIG